MASIWQEHLYIYKPIYLWQHIIPQSDFIDWELLLDKLWNYEIHTYEK